MKNKNLMKSFDNAVNGIIYTLRSEHNMKIHVAAAVIILVLSLVYKLTKEEFLIICLTIGAVIICELFNTAIEAVVDIIIDEYHPKAKIAKDVAAGAVLISAFISVLVGYAIFYDKVRSSLETGIKIVHQSPMQLTIIALVLTIIVVLVMKAYFKKGTPFHGGMPSGHAAISFSVTTAIALWLENAGVTILCLLLSLLVIQSRHEGKIHSLFELFAGTAIGFLVTLLLFQVFL